MAVTTLNHFNHQPLRCDSADIPDLIVAQLTFCLQTCPTDFFIAISRLF